MWLIDRERKQPGSIWSLLTCLTTFILLCVALGGLSSRSNGIKSVFIAHLDFSNANWQMVVPGLDNFRGHGFPPIQRMNLWNNCNGDYDMNGGFDAINPYRTWYSTSLDPRYAVSHQLNSLNPGAFTRDEINTPSGTVIPRVQSGTIIVLTTIACVLNGIAFFCQLLRIPGFVIPKIIAVIFLLVANTMVHVLAKRMVNSFNNNYGTFGIQADLGGRYLAMVWNAFGILLISAALQFTRGPGGIMGNYYEDNSPKFDPEAMKHGYTPNYNSQQMNKQPNDMGYNNMNYYNNGQMVGNYPNEHPPPPAYH